MRALAAVMSRAASRSTSGPTDASGLGSGRWASEAGGRARLACTVAATAIAANPQMVPAASPVIATIRPLEANPPGEAMYSRSSSQDAAPTRKPMPKKVTDEKTLSA